MRIIVVLLLAVAAATVQARFQVKSANFAAARVDAQAIRIATLAKTLEDLAGKINQATESDLITRAKDLETRISNLEPEMCSDNEFHCGEDNQCVSNLMVCDKVSDCENGADESVCDPPVVTGSTWAGTASWEACRTGPDTSFTVMITKFKQFTYFPSKVYLEAIVHDEQRNEDYRTKGYFVYGNRNAILLPSDDDRLDDRLGIKCHFTDSDTADCSILTESSLTECARVTLNRQ